MNAPWKSGAAGNRDPFSAYICDDLSLDVVRSVCDDMGWAQEKANKGGLRNAVQSLSVAASPQILLIDLSESGDPINDINSLAEVCEPGTMVIAMGQVNDVRLYRDLMMSGLHDYLLKPVSPDMLRDAISHAQVALNAPRAEDPKYGPIDRLFGSRHPFWHWRAGARSGTGSRFDGRR
jgi:pilus assembly protein CpaE